MAAETLVTCPAQLFWASFVVFRGSVINRAVAVYFSSLGRDGVTITSFPAYMLFLTGVATSLVTSTDASRGLTALLDYCWVRTRGRDRWDTCGF